ncbi:uncharacterized protein A4U43_C01F410 [Asparagus officinalis]|uniref:BZIP domain-containing protein n=1 Tax=Asparagus officinalis TaxID=4686 RepID=A0A5P1FPG5_ASPOF|nr:uncharacterized protein LOC109845099 [Asparagus officinalis]ONK78869.1 uncharacterized protein A4U43_C01F410 [Asparagus officinalis]
MDSEWDRDFFEPLNQAQDPQWADVETSSQDSPGEIGESLSAGDLPQEHSNTEIEQTNEELRHIKRKQQNKEAQRRSRIKKKLERENREKQLHEVGLALQECYGISIAELLEKYRSIMC